MIFKDFALPEDEDVSNWRNNHACEEADDGDGVERMCQRKVPGGTSSGSSLVFIEVFKVVEEVIYCSKTSVSLKAVISQKEAPHSEGQGCH